MNRRKSAVVVIAAPEGSAALTGHQKTFNRLIKKIEGQRKLLQTWQETFTVFNQKRQTEFMPLLRGYDEQRTKLLKLFDKAHTEFRLTKAEKTKVEDIISSLASELLSTEDDPERAAELTAIFDKYNDISFAEEQEDANDSFKRAMEDMMGIDLGDDFNPDSPEEVLAALHRKIGETGTQQGAHEFGNQQPRKPSAKTRAKQAKLEEEAQGVSQSIREVYRKLASALHPDREPDHTERDRKTALMQRVNMAYDKKDLLQLLELQLEIEQIDHAALGTIADGRLKHYNKILKEQSAELDAEVFSVEARFGFVGFTPRRQRLDPKFVMRQLETDIAKIKLDIHTIKRDLQDLNDVKVMKSWLRGYRIRQGNAFDIFTDFDEF